MKGIWFTESKVKLYSIHICMRNIPESKELHIAAPPPHPDYFKCISHENICTFVVPSFKNTASIFLEICFIQYVTIF